MSEGCRLKRAEGTNALIREKVDYSPSSRRTVNLYFRHSLGSQPQSSSKEKTASTAFCNFFIANVPAWLPCLFTFLPEPESYPKSENCTKNASCPYHFYGASVGATGWRGWNGFGRIIVILYSALGYTGGVLVKDEYFTWAYCLLRNLGHAGDAGRAFPYCCRACQRC